MEVLPADALALVWAPTPGAERLLLARAVRRGSPSSPKCELRDAGASGGTCAWGSCAGSRRSMRGCIRRERESRVVCVCVCE